MKLRNIVKNLLIVSALGFMFQGCATIIAGKSNTLVFTEESLPAAQVFVDGEQVGEAPGKIKLPKSKIQHGSILTLKASGYEDKEYLILRKQSRAYSIVDLLLGGIPLIVDYTTGNIYRPVPRKFDYELVKK